MGSSRIYSFTDPAVMSARSERMELRTKRAMKMRNVTRALSEIGIGLLAVAITAWITHHL
jgi:hypothetical protein